MVFPLRGATAVVTGAASGIGAALAQALAVRGANLALADRNEAGLEVVAARVRPQGGRVSTHLIDVTDHDAIDALPAAVLAEHGEVDVLVNNAGVAMAGFFADISIDEFSWLFEINFWAPVRLTRAFMPALSRAPIAHIVNMSSLFGLVAPPGQVAYSASKFALRGFSEALRHELEGSSISLTVVHPGGVRTEIANSARVPEKLDPAEVRKGIGAMNKHLRMPPDQAAELIARAIEKRSKRLVIGNDAKLVSILQRLFPAGYWQYVKPKTRAASKEPANG
jgi:short-subunit dehydrogenase